MVTMNKWLFQSLYSGFREECIIDKIMLEAVADLGSRAFDPENKFHDGVQVAMFIFSNTTPVDGCRFASVNATFDEKDQGGKYWAKLTTSGLDKIHIDGALRRASGREQSIG